MLETSIDCRRATSALVERTEITAAVENDPVRDGSKKQAFKVIRLGPSRRFAHWHSLGNHTYELVLDESVKMAPSGRESGA
jgi:hypothetical protein